MSSAAVPPGYGIRPLRIGDAAAVAAAYLRNRAHLAPWDPVRAEEFYTEAGQRRSLADQLDLVGTGRAACWVAEHGGVVVGRVNLNNILRGVLRSAAVGYWVDHQHLRRGLALALVEHACTEALGLGLHRVEASTLPHNEASRGVLRRAGFSRYGHAPDYLFIAGRWRDHDLFQRILHDDPL